MRDAACSLLTACDARSIPDSADLQGRTIDGCNRDGISAGVRDAADQHLARDRVRSCGRCADHREGHHPVALVPDRHAVCAGHQFHGEAGFILVLRCRCGRRLEPVLRPVTVRVHIVHLVVQILLVQRLMEVRPPAVAAAEIIPVRVAGVVHMRDRHRHPRAVHRCVLVQEDQIAVRQAHLPRAGHPSGGRVVGQVVLQTGQGAVEDLQMRDVIARVMRGVEHAAAGRYFAGRQRHAVIRPLIPFPRQPRDVKRNLPPVGVALIQPHVILHAVGIEARLAAIADLGSRPGLLNLPGIDCRIAGWRRVLVDDKPRLGHIVVCGQCRQYGKPDKAVPGQGSALRGVKPHMRAVVRVRRIAADPGAFHTG